MRLLPHVCLARCPRTVQGGDLLHVKWVGGWCSKGWSTRNRPTHPVAFLSTPAPRLPLCMSVSLRACAQVRALVLPVKSSDFSKEAEMPEWPGLVLLGHVMSRVRGDSMLGRGAPTFPLNLAWPGLCGGTLRALVGPGT